MALGRGLRAHGLRPGHGLWRGLAGFRLRFLDGIDPMRLSCGHGCLLAFGWLQAGEVCPHLAPRVFECASFLVDFGPCNPRETCRRDLPRSVQKYDLTRGRTLPTAVLD